MGQSGDGLAFNWVGHQLTVREPGARKIVIYFILGNLQQPRADNNYACDIT